MPRRKAAEVETLPPEDDQQSRGRKKLVEAEHTIKYSAPMPVTVEEESEENDLLFDDDPVDTEKKRKRKTAKTERDELRKKMMSHGVTAASTLKLIIERYVHSDGPDSGTTADKSHCTKYGCDEAHILNQDYMNVAARWGAGRYWFTLYKDGTIVTQWEKKLEPPRPTASPIIQHVNPNDPTSPQVIIQPTSDGQVQPMSMRDIMKAQKEAFKEQLEMAKLMREAYGLQPEQPAQQPRTEEEVLTSAILKQPEVIENVVGSVIKRFGGKGSGEDEPWYAEPIKEAVRNGQASEIVASFIREIMAPLRNIWGGQNNGQAQMAQAPIQTGGAVDSQPGDIGRDVVAQEVPQGNQALQPANGEANQQSGMLPAATTEEQALQLLIDHCRRGAPVKVAYGRLMEYAGLLNEQYPQGSIDDYIDIFAAMPVDQALEFVKTQPNGEAVASLPHAKEWTSQLQQLIREADRRAKDEQ